MWEVPFYEGGAGDEGDVVEVDDLESEGEDVRRCGSGVDEV